MYKPYIGITDFMTYKQVTQMLTVFNTHRSLESQRKLHVGVMMSYKTLHGIETKWSQAFPPKETIAEIFSSKETVNCLHYADYDNDPEFVNSLSQAIFWGGTGINAIQLDMVWPDPKQVEKVIRASGKSLDIILQVNTKALEHVNNDPSKLVERIKRWEGLTTYILLDKSMGKGLGMDANGLIPFAQAIQDYFPDIGIVAAGGLGPDTLHLVSSLVEMFPDISIDAQGKLRPSGNALDPVDFGLAGAYLKKALMFLH